MFDWFAQTFSEMQIYQWEVVLGDWFFVASIALLLMELIRYAIKKHCSRHLLGDVLANFVTLGLFLGITAAIGIIYLNLYYAVYEWRFFTLEMTPLSILAAVILADFVYYWEHRFTHRVGIGWATHTVHHSSPHFNISIFCSGLITLGRKMRSAPTLVAALACCIRPPGEKSRL
ncbi:MAG: sterol desaturase family protein [Pseudomonadota bacterium]